MNNLLDVKIDEINNFVKKINTDNGVLNKKNLWDDKELNIIIPMMMFGVENWTLVDESPLVDNPEFFLLSRNQPSSFYITMFSKNDKYNDKDK